MLAFLLDWYVVPVCIFYVLKLNALDLFGTNENGIFFSGMCFWFVNFVVF